MTSPLAAARAYAAVQSAVSPMSGEPPTAAKASAEPAFADILKTAVNDVVATSRHAEGQMAAHMQGKADLVDVVTAISSAQASLETVMAVRDQVISAYQEIMRMPI